jgi:hypothetical protein
LTKRIVALALMAALGAGGCSFRYPLHVTGHVAALTVPEEHSANMPLILVGKAQFKGNFENPVLTVVYPASDAHVIKVSAVASPKEPFMGLGIFANGTSTSTVEVRGSIMVEKPGQYVIESLSAEAGLPSFMGTLTVR